MSNDSFQSSDSVRSSKPLRYIQNFNLTEPLKLELGGQLTDVTVAYETYGQLSPARDNAVLVCHALSGDSHVAQHNPEDDPGWWDIMIGPGRPIDTNRFFVICPNLLGGCRGTTGPCSKNPATGKPYGNDFPTITIGDMVAVQLRLIDHLGIDKLLAVVGGSVGGHQAMTWAIRHVNRLHGVAALATSPRLTSQALAFDVVGRNAIRRDPQFHKGQYYDQPRGPEVGLALARMIGHITYLSREAMTEKFDPHRLQPRDVATEFEKIFSVGSYLGYQGSRFVERFDANSYIKLSLAMDLFDLGNTPEKLAETLRGAACRWLVVSFSSDWLFPPDQSRDIVNALIANRIPVSYCDVRSSCGHDAFLLPNEFPIYGEMVRGFLANLEKAKDAAENSGEPLLPERAATTIFPKHRIDYDRIVQLIPDEATVLDLGCGTGRLLARLQLQGRRRLVGIEVDERKILQGIQRGLDVVYNDLNAGLKAFGDQEFDCVVLSQTLQAVSDVEGVIADMLRVGKQCVVSFPNLAYHKLRKVLAEQGRAPRGYCWHDHEWYNTPNIRFLSIADFEAFCAQKNIRIQRRIALCTENESEVTEDPNLNADLAIFVISR